MKIKKFTGLLVSLICTILLLVPLSANAAVDATSYNSCDVDRNGAVNILDVIALNNTLLGKSYIADFNQMDADRNGIINHSDSECILAQLVGQSYVSVTDGMLVAGTSGTVSATDPTVIPVSSATYVVYDYAKSTTSTYNLSIKPQTTTATATIEYNGIIGDDNRKYLTNQSEYTGIVQISLGLQASKGVDAYTDEGKALLSYSTGFIVGDHQIATAAHCVYDCYTKDTNNYYFLTDIGKKRNKIYLYDENGNKNGITFTPVEAHIPLGYYKNHRLGDGDDYALITVEEDLSDLSDYIEDYSCTYFDLGLVNDIYDSSFSKATLYVSGVPGEVNGKNNNLSSNAKIFKGTGHTISTYGISPESIIFHDADQSGGNSGGPVYVVTKYKLGNAEYVSNYTVVGIVSLYDKMNPRNGATRITPLLQKFYLNNDKIK